MSSWMALAAAFALLGLAVAACGGRQPCSGPVHEIDRSPPAASASEAPR
jgi:hypothetical protein